MTRAGSGAEAAPSVEDGPAGVVPGPSERPSAMIRGYRLLGVVAAAHSVSHMHSALLPIVYPAVMQEFGLNYAALGLIMAVGDVLGNLMQGSYGALSRRHMRRTLLGLGNIALGVSMMFTAAAVGFFTFLMGNVLGRLAKSPQHPVGSSLIADSFGKRLRGRALAIDFAGGNAGTLLVPFLGTYVVATYGWRVALGVFSVLPLITGLLCFRLIPADTLQVAPGRRGNGRHARFLEEFFAPLRHRPVRLVVLAATLAAGGRGIGVVMVYVPLYLQQSLGITGGGYATLFTLLMVGSVVGPLLMGHISDVLSRRGTLAVAYVLAAGSMLALAAVDGRVWFLAPLILSMGVVVYAQSSLVRALLADVSSEGSRSSAFSTFFVVSYLGGSAWSLVLGLTVDGLGFDAAFVIMAISYVAALLPVLAVRAREG